MSNNILKLLFLFLCSYINAQMGINTTTPQAVVDVNGDVALRKALIVPSTTTPGNLDSGTVDQVLVSGGAGQPPSWKSVRIPFMENTQYKLVNTYLKNDQSGITTLSNGVAPSTPAVNVIGEDFSASWIKITNLTTNIQVRSSENKITYQLQSGVELVNKSVGIGASVNFICGIFKDNKLVALRPDGITTVDATPVQSIYTLNYTEDNVSVGLHTFDVACRKISSSDVVNNYFRIGVNIPSYGPAPTVTNNKSNAFALRSLFKVDVAELVTYTN
jgi:hypothetical protein